MTNPIKILDYDAIASIELGSLITWELVDPSAAPVIMDLERSENGGPWVKIWEISTDWPEYIDAGVTLGARYRYRVRTKGDTEMEWLQGIRILIEETFTDAQL